MTKQPFRYPFKEADRPNRIRYWREQREMTQEKLADMLHTTRATINKYETGRHPVTVERLRDIACALRVSTADLLMPKDNPLALDAEAQRIMEAWTAIPPEKRGEMAEIVLSVLRLAGPRVPADRRQPS